MTAPTKPSRGWDAPTTALVGVMLVLPWVVLYWLDPWLSTLSIGADYPAFSINDQLILQFSLAHGTMPLFVPGFAFGQSVGAATLGQLFHPVSHLAALLPEYWSGGALRNYTLVNLLTLGLTGAAVSVALRRIGIGPVATLLASFLLLFNLRMLDFLRYGASLQSYLGFVLASVALLRLAAVGPTARGVVLLAVATTLMLCSGHPQAAYLGMLGLVVIAPLAPILVADLAPGAHRARPTGMRFLASAGAGLALGTLLASAYLLPFGIDFALDARQRTANDFAWVYTPFGTASVTSLLHSVFKPLWSDVHGSFAGSALFAVPLLLPLLRLLRPIPRSIWLCWSLAIVILAVALAQTLPLYFVLWKLVPGFSAFRVPGRVTMLAPLPLALVLAWIVECEPVVVQLLGKARRIAPATILGAAAALLYLVYGLLPWPAEANELAPPIRINELAPHVGGIVRASGVAALVLLAWYGASRSRLVAAGLVLVVVAQQALVLRAGTWVVQAGPTRTYAELEAMQRGSPGFHGDPGAALEPATITTWRGTLGKRARRPPLSSLHWLERRVASRDEALLAQQDGRRPGEVFVEDTAADLPAAPRPERRGESVLEEVTFNRQRFVVTVLAPALLRVGQPHSANWSATIDGHPVPVLRVDGAWLGVRVPRGRSVVELRYLSPAAFWGMVVSCLTACGLGVTLALGFSRRPVRIAVGALVALAVARGFVAWQNSLYDGKSLGTESRWSNLGETERK